MLCDIGRLKDRWMSGRWSEDSVTSARVANLILIAEWRSEPVYYAKLAGASPCLPANRQYIWNDVPYALLISYRHIRTLSGQGHYCKAYKR